MAKIRRCSIELEPMTLSQGQLSQAREVAQDVVKKLEPNEASALFIEGLEHPVKETDIEDADEAEKVGSCIQKQKQKAEDMNNDEKAWGKVCSCNYNNALAIVELKSPQSHIIIHPLSAPF
ncbi:uncharacterized protein G2W53_000294 [Senna tora]|uniref:Uncharacterized protein n=1 Tax=Senna tora TaxID=362788 RepID=A0A835CIC3_9FABA|nr:uncharacterized protein G2W53_000294 [Senna tora]